MSPESGFNSGPVIKVESISEQLRRRRGGRDPVPWGRRDWVFAFLAVPLFAAVSLATIEALRHAPLSVIAAAVLGTLVGAPAGVVIGSVATVLAFVSTLLPALVTGHALVVLQLAESVTSLDGRSRRTFLLLFALLLEWLGSGIGGALGLVVNPAFGVGETLSPHKTGVALLGGASGILAVWLRRRVQWSLFRNWQDPFPRA